MNDLYINDFEINCSLGEGAAEVKKNLLNPNFEAHPTKVELVSGRTTLFFSVQGPLSDLPMLHTEFNSRNNQLALSTLRNLKSNVDRLKVKYGSHRIGVVTATSTTGIDYFERALLEGNGELEIKNYNMSLQEVGSLNSFVSSYLGLNSLSYGISTACSSGAKVFAEAQRLIFGGFCDAVVVGGCDSFCDLTVNGFDSLGATSESICAPFSEHRSGINIGEGAAFFIISREPSEYKILAVGESSDAFHISSPEPEGKGAELAIRKALKQANKGPQDISYINLHGTATRRNDSMEALLVNRIFGADVPVSSTKPMAGHTLGAAGAIEVAFCLLCLSDVNNEGRLPVQQGGEEWDSGIPKLNFVTRSARSSGSVMMSNSFAFGGSNASVILEGI